MSTSTLEQAVTACLPLLIEANQELRSLAAPKATQLSERLAMALVVLCDLADDYELYGLKWGGDSVLGRVARQLGEIPR